MHSAYAFLCISFGGGKKITFLPKLMPDCESPNRRGELHRQASVHYTTSVVRASHSIRQRRQLTNLRVDDYPQSPSCHAPDSHKDHGPTSVGPRGMTSDPTLRLEGPSAFNPPILDPSQRNDEKWREKRGKEDVDPEHCHVKRTHPDAGDERSEGSAVARFHAIVSGVMVQAVQRAIVACVF